MLSANALLVAAITLLVLTGPSGAQTSSAPQTTRNVDRFIMIENQGVFIPSGRQLLPGIVVKNGGQDICATCNCCKATAMTYQQFQAQYGTGAVSQIQPRDMVVIEGIGTAAPGKSVFVRGTTFDPKLLDIYLKKSSSQTIAPWDGERKIIEVNLPKTAQ